MLFAGYTLRGEHEFPYHVVKGRPQVAKAISNDEGKSGWKWSDEIPPSGIGCWIYIGDQGVSVTVELPTQFGNEGIVVLCGPEDFEQD
jgi:hypothetical protein